MKLPILVYHKIDRIPPGSRYPRQYVTPEQFATHLAFLARHGYTSIGFPDYLAYRRGERRLPRRAIILTFDDGYRSTRTIALPLLRQYGFTATIFLVAAYVGQTNLWDEAEMQEPLLDAGDIQDMQAKGIEFGSHTATHPALAGTLRLVLIPVALAGRILTRATSPPRARRAAPCPRPRRPRSRPAPCPAPRSLPARRSTLLRRAR